MAARAREGAVAREARILEQPRAERHLGRARRVPGRHRHVVGAREGLPPAGGVEGVLAPEAGARQGGEAERREGGPERRAGHPYRSLPTCSSKVETAPRNWPASRTGFAGGTAAGKAPLSSPRLACTAFRASAFFADSACAWVP